MKSVINIFAHSPFNSIFITSQHLIFCFDMSVFMSDVSVFMSDVSVFMSDVSVFMSDVSVFMSDVSVFMSDVSVFMSDQDYRCSIKTILYKVYAYYFCPVSLSFTTTCFKYQSGDPPLLLCHRVTWVMSPRCFGQLIKTQ